jgi:ATP-binding cassette subfamily B protein
MARNTYAVDEELTNEFNIHVLRRLAGYLRPHGKTVALTVGLMVAVALGDLVIPLILKEAIDRAIPARDLGLLAILAGALALAQALAALCLRFRIRAMNRMGQEIIHAIRGDVFKRVQELPLSYFDSRPLGKILIRVVNYVNSISDLLSNGLINFITDLFKLALIVAFMAAIHLPLTLVCLAGVPVLGGAILLMKKRQRVSWQAMSRKQANLNAYLHEALAGAKVTQSFARESFNEGIFERLSAEWKSSWLKAVGNLFLVGPTIEIVSVLVACTAYAAGVGYLGAGMSVGVLVAFVGYIWRFWTPFATIGNFYSALVQSGAYLERIFETIDEPRQIEDRPGAYELPPIRGHVEFRSVCFAYEAGAPVLQDFSLTARPGESVAIVGPTGAGKTTIVNLLSRFYDPDSGAIFVDGHDIRALTLASLRRQVGVMLQEPFLFSGSVRDNIRYGRLNASDEEIEAAARAVHAHDFIMGLEQGYDTPANERGMRLSMGQRQLICFARVLLSNPAILILDEATSSVDTETERLIQKGIAGLLRGRTSFIIAHRLSTIRNADRIIYLEGGRIREEGRHEELLALGRAYAALFRRAQEAALAAAEERGTGGIAAIRAAVARRA